MMIGNHHGPRDGGRRAHADAAGGTEVPEGLWHHKLMASSVLLAWRPR